MTRSTKNLIFVLWMFILAALLLANCVAPPEKIATFGDGSLSVKTWKTKSGSVAFTRFIDVETGVICYYYSGKFACAK